MLYSIDVVAVRPIYARNVGMCARAIANMGAHRLILIAPRFEFGDEYKQGAAHAQSVLEDAQIYYSMEEFLAHEGNGWRIALSGRQGTDAAQINFENVVDRMLEASTDTIQPPETIHPKQITKIYLFFGPENDGLSDSEMAICHHAVPLPTFGPIQSMNLSHAVMLALYITQSKIKSVKGISVGSGAGPGAANQPMYYPTQSIRAWLLALGFNLDSPKTNVEKTINRIFLSGFPTADELRVLDSVLQQTIRKLRPPSQTR